MTESRTFRIALSGSSVVGGRSRNVVGVRCAVSEKAYGTKWWPRVNPAKHCALSAK
jgi:hypothetical protein